MHLYEYNGPVYEFTECINSCWTGQTRAVSEKKARSNLAYQYKKEHNRSRDSMIVLKGDIIDLTELERGEL